MISYLNRKKCGYANISDLTTVSFLQLLMDIHDTRCSFTCSPLSKLISSLSVALTCYQMEGMSAGRHGDRSRKWEIISQTTSWKQKEQIGSRTRLSTLKFHTFSNKAAPLKPPQRVRATEDQVFKCLSLYRISFF